MAITARVLAQAEKTGLDLVTPCSSCYTILHEANDLMKEDHKLAWQVHEALSTVGLTYNGTVKVRHIVEVLYNDVGLEALAVEGKTSPDRAQGGLLSRLPAGAPRVRLRRPRIPRLAGPDSQSPGGGTGQLPAQGQVLRQLAGHIRDRYGAGPHPQLLQNAADNGAQAIVSTTCPLCHTALDAYQSAVNSKFKTRFNLPVLAVPQLIAVALGFDFKQAALDGNIVSPRKLLNPYFSGKTQAAPKEAAQKAAG